MKLSYKKYGEGQPLLIFHGLFGSGDNWTTHAKNWSNAGYSVYCIDQRNHGHSEHNQVMTYEAMAEDAIEFIAEHQLRDILLLGHSMGGKTVLHLAEQIPFLISKMIVVDMGIKAYPPHHGAVFKALNSLSVESLKSRGEAEEHMKKSSLDSATQLFLLKNLYWKSPEQLAWRFNLPVLQEQINNILMGFDGKITDIETLFIKGGHSNYILTEDIPEIKKSINQAAFKTLDRSGHWPHAEEPQLFYETVLDFISN
ncbi:MAG: alpha/beta fold hydrolase [Bacteroidota bacterium]|jgi:esterase